MTQLDQRHAELLCGLVEEYINTAQPVGSTALQRAMRLDISPATIRGILQDLDETGYLYQPHTSAGRVPTDQGYRFYVDSLRAKQLAARQHQQLQQTYRAAQGEGAVSEALAQFLARLSSAYVMTGQLPNRQIAQAGLSNVVDNTDTDNLPTVREISWLADHIHEVLERMAQQGTQTTVYIGTENPFYEGQHTSLLIRTVTTDDETQRVVTLIGPKRMPYQQNITLLNEVAQLFN